MNVALFDTLGDFVYVGVLAARVSAAAVLFAGVAIGAVLIARCRQ